MTTKTELTEEEKDQKFLEVYQQLCEKYKRGIQASPAWRYSEDGNDFRLIINITVSRWPKD